jgi:hypothetical protein
MIMECKDCLFLFDDYIAEELEEGKFSRLSEHLALCKSCSFNYQELRLQQEAIEQYLLQAEATPALWKSLQTAIKQEKIIQSSSYTTPFSKNYKKVFSVFGLIFSPRGMVLIGLGIVVFFTLIFLLIRSEDSSSEYAEKNEEFIQAPATNEPAKQSDFLTFESPVKETSQPKKKNPVLPITEKPLELRRIKPSNEPRGLLPHRNSEEENSKKVSQPAEQEKDLLPGERKYLETIAKLTAEVKSIEADMPPVLSEEYKRNLSAVDQAIVETRKSAQRHPKNPDVMNFVYSAYQGKIALLSDVAKQ